MACAGNHCWVSFLIWFLVWLVAASGLLVATWNKVICDIFKMKPAKHWQCLLFLLTLSVLCIPRMYMHRHHSECCQGMMKGDECPYQKK